MNRRGSALVELALITPILLLILLAVVEFGRVLEMSHAATGLSRESANIAARGSTLQEAIDAAMISGSDIRLNKVGGVVASRLTRQGNKTVVTEQKATAPYVGRSRVGAVGQPAGDLSNLPLQPGQNAFVIEVFAKYSPIAPLGLLAKSIIPRELYSRSVF